MQVIQMNLNTLPSRQCPLVSSKQGRRQEAYYRVKNKEQELTNKTSQIGWTTWSPLVCGDQPGRQPACLVWWDTYKGTEAISLLLYNMVAWWEQLPLGTRMSFQQSEGDDIFPLFCFSCTPSTYFNRLSLMLF